MLNKSDTSKKFKKKGGVLEKELYIGSITVAQKAFFAKHLAVMIKAGLTLTEALNIAKDSVRGKFKQTLREILRSVESGRSFSDSLADYPRVFSGLFVSAIYAGEASGTLAENLENVAEEMEKEKELIAKVKGAMIYPAVILSATFVLGMILAFFVLPKITPLFQGLRVDLPFSTMALIWFSNFVQSYGFILFPAIIVFVIFMIWLVNQKFVKPVTHWLFLKTPIVRDISRGVNIARFCRTFGTLLRSGLPIGEALDVAKKTAGNYYYQTALGKVSIRITKGTRLSDNLNRFEQLFPLIVTKMIKVGEESGKLEEVLLYLADFYEAEVDTATKSLSTAIEPILLMFIGLLVGFLALSIITPIYNITGNIRR